MSNNKLYIGNLSFQASEGELERTFMAHGDVKSVKIITDRDTGRSKGFGFIEMETEEQALQCIEQFDGKDLDGRNVRVNIAQDRKDSPRQARW